MRHVMRHEVEHVIQPRALVGEAAELDAERYATRSRMSFIDELYGGVPRAS